VFLWCPRLRAPALVLSLALCCVCLHELGHVLAGVCMGRQVNEFVLLSLRPHVDLSVGPNAGEQAFTAAAGTGLVILTWFSILLLKRSGASWIVDVFSGYALVELLGWTLSSLWPPRGTSIDDAERFLAMSGLNPMFIVTACALLASAGLLLRFVKTR
jgi:hypothetical protein